MGKPLTEESKKTEPKFNIELDKETHIKLIDYLLLTDDATGRNRFINDLIKEKLSGKVLDNSFILLDEPYYFNKNELLENGIVKAIKDSPPFPNIDEISVVQLVPNNLDDFDKELKTYCVGGNQNKHTGYYILPKYKDHDEKHFLFRYDSDKEEIEISIAEPDKMDIVFNPLDDKKQAIKKLLIYDAITDAEALANGNLTAEEMIYKYNVMYSYYLNLELHEINNRYGGKPKFEDLSEKDKAERSKIIFDGIYF